jgi:hypothetical protein
MLFAEIGTLDALLTARATVLGEDFTAYRNHTYRVANFCLALTAPDADTFEKVAVASAFHDIGIWTDHTFDYLAPSVRNAGDYLRETEREEWLPEIEAMITEHHKIRPWRVRPEWLVEPFRRADWADVSLGLVAPGLSRALVREVRATWPNAGFHKRLVQLTLERARRHPFSPVPVLRL